MDIILDAWDFVPRPFDKINLPSSFIIRNEGHIKLVLTIMTRYNNAPVDEWDAIQAGIDLPNLQRTFAGIFFADVNIIYKWTS